jgi:Domain of unkown function (DUF1775)
MHRTSIATAAGSAALLAALALPDISSAHTTISALQPQGPALTSARATYAVRSPNERARQSTYKITMLVPRAVQTSISIKHDSNWKVTTKRVRTGQTGEGGDPVFAITSVSWTAKTRDDAIRPSEYGEWPVRFQNPATAQSLCFGFRQYYRNASSGARRRPEVVNWTGAANSDTPASCLPIVASPS